MPAQVPDIDNVFHHMRIKVSVPKTRHIVFVIGTQIDGNAPLFPDLHLQVSDEGASDAFSLMGQLYNHWMQFPNVAIVPAGRTNPAQDRAVIINGNAIDPAPQAISALPPRRHPHRAMHQANDLGILPPASLPFGE